MKAGGVKFADTPEEAAEHALGDPRPRDRRPHAGRRPRRPEGRGRAGVLRGGPLGPARAPPDDAVQRHGRDRHRAGRRRAPRSRRPRPPRQPPPDRRLHRQGGRRPLRDDRHGADPGDDDPRPARPAAARLRHDAGRDQPGRPARRRLVRRPRRPHGDGGRGRRPPQADADRDRRRPQRTPRDVRAERVRAQRQGDRRGRPPRRHPGQGPRLHRQHRPRDRRRRRLADAHRRGSQPGRQARQLRGDRRQPFGREVLRPRQGGAAEGRRREDRRDDVDRLQHPGRHRRPRRHQGLPRARQGPGRDDRDLPDPGRLGGRGLQDPRQVRRRVLRPLASRCGRPPAAPSPRSRGRRRS